MASEVGGNAGPYAEYWKITRRAYFTTYVSATIFSAGMLLSKGFVCMSEEDLVCIAPICAAAQAACLEMVGYQRIDVCCYNGTVLPCHIRFWFILVNWGSVFAQCAEKIMRHDLLKVDENFSKETMEFWQGTTYTCRHFLDKVGQVWATIMLLQAYLSPDWMAYVMALLDSNTCVFLFNVSFIVQLGFVVLDTVTTALLFVASNIAQLFKPVSKMEALQKANKEALELEERTNRNAQAED